MDTTKVEQLVRLFTLHQDELFRYLLTFLPDVEDAREALQETQVALYQKAFAFDLDAPFLPLAIGFARQQILKERERSRKARRHLSPDVVAILASRREGREEALTSELEALEDCLQSLPDADRALIELRYHGEATLNELAGDTGTSRRTLCRSLERIRRRLYVCMTRRLGSDAG